MKRYKIAVIGATGAVGRQLISLLGNSLLPIGKVIAFASEDSIGETVEFGAEELNINLLDKHSFVDVDITVFLSTREISEEFTKEATESGAVVIDCTGLYASSKDIPTVIPYLNTEDIELYKNTGIIASPHPISIQLATALMPIDMTYTVKRIIASTYQSVSGMGMKAMDELLKQTRSWFEFGYDEIKPEIMPTKIAFNCIPQAGRINSDGSTDEEERIETEIARLFHNQNITTNITCVYVPVFSGHATSVTVETESAVDIHKIEELFENESFCRVEKGAKDYLTPVEITGRDFVSIGRIRQNRTNPTLLSAWLTSDNLLTGSASNIMRIIELLIKEYL